MEKLRGTKLFSDLTSSFLLHHTTTMPSSSVLLLVACLSEEERNDERDKCLERERERARSELVERGMLLK